MNGSSGEPYTLTAFLNDLRPSRAELYSILSFVLTWVGSLLCFVPVYYNGVNGYVPSEISLRRNFKGSVLEQSVNSEQYQTALLLRWVRFRCCAASFSGFLIFRFLPSVIIAVPMLVDILLDAYYVFRFRSGRKLHWFARFWLLCRYYSSPRSVWKCSFLPSHRPSSSSRSLTIPSILMLNTFPDKDSDLPRSTFGYVSTEACKRIASTGCMFMFIAQVLSQLSFCHHLIT
jgi:hypothetical protein